ncbi:predicted protein [Histoplasma capsulatum G186AR]|uniref:Uncharacterized protein n=1 Tax=Ajellomyces capsulatus (strain G186AR / H82 / ATCC MYA-2454 / RMSCC 2432) TaxID=447093 RepID=C0NTI9_AJECG|nr:uncharacterized protein HCBG_06469 [Histoplasma capsulatum G186AR]EEH05350.1 predicted protein [Histoplasma capsulatum G186AR]
MPLFARALDRGRDERGHDQRGDPRHRQEPVSASLRLWGLGGEMADRDSEHLLNFLPPPEKTSTTLCLHLPKPPVPDVLDNDKNSTDDEKEEEEEKKKETQSEDP